MERIEQRQPPIAGGNRQGKALREPLHCVTCRRGPTAAADDDKRPLRLVQQLFQLAHLGGPGRGFDRLMGRSIRRHYPLSEHVLGERNHHGPRTATGCGVECTRNDFRQPLGIVDLGHPFCHTAECGTKIKLLQRLAILDVARDLPGEHDQRR